VRDTAPPDFGETNRAAQRHNSGSVAFHRRENCLAGLRFNPVARTRRRVKRRLLPTALDPTDRERLLASILSPGPDRSGFFLCAQWLPNCHSRQSR
jgi:hypothetical protein